ncbi:Pyrimidine reductase, riboflavin biosynthesis [Pedococcus dokdonensis]|uniref:Pyrimidine reductase, riboflavin biosynthesis n=1 Tax=Pedococcus dokdonensis TaxID=443156 RepID=A0A1H0N666_9MICO|nr:dihydrofolate reductase family protein [Pedococcus dokdonensis]SDO88184.1 Pyrimidine reductase, riboflavin biosynthesis [Pedococcus dokdonensis]
MRLLLDSSSTHTPGETVDDSALADLYVAPARRWLRANFVATLDGAANGPDNKSGSINTDADHIVFDLLRRLTDVVVVGAGTVRAEGYPSLRAEDPRAPVLMVVSHQGAVPPSVLDGPFGSVYLITREGADPATLDASRDSLGEEFVLTAGTDAVDFVKMRNMLEDKGYRQILCEGGPSLLNSMLAAGVVDELDLTWSPVIVGGEHPTITRGPDLHLPASPTLLLEENGTILGRWFVNR